MATQRSALTGVDRMERMIAPAATATRVHVESLQIVGLVLRIVRIERAAAHVPDASRVERYDAFPHVAVEKVGVDLIGLRCIPADITVHNFTFEQRLELTFSTSNSEVADVANHRTKPIFLFVFD